MSLSPLTFVVIVGIETNKSYRCFDCNLYQYIRYFWIKIIIVFNLFLDWNHQVIQIGICFGSECIFRTGIIISFVSDQNSFWTRIIISFCIRSEFVLDQNYYQFCFGSVVPCHLSIVIIR